jgi:3-polyprenyl-4-hydroxybenzoate decarboxylase
MKATRRLVLKKETLAELSTAELRDVAAAGQQLTPNCPTYYCASGRLECMVSNYIDPCTSGPTAFVC